MGKGGIKLDTTNRYLKKCAKAQVLQEGYREIKEGDFILFLKTFDYNIKANEVICCGHHITTPDDSILFGYSIYDGSDGDQSFWRKDFIWLPRIDQLMDILKVEWQDNLTYVEIIQEFNDWFTPLKYTEICHHTPEELWLDFVMYKLYDMIWQKGNWVKKDG